MQKQQVKLTRELAWVIYSTAPFVDKKIRTIDRFWPIEKKDGKPSEEMIKVMQLVTEKYKEQVAELNE